MKNLIYLSILLFCICCQNVKKITKKPEILKLDTLKAPSKKISSTKCEKETYGFKNKLGLHVSNFYVVSQKIESTKDSIAILKPFYVETTEYDCFPKVIDENILIVFNIENKKTNIYKNLLFSDDRNVYQELKPNNNGFIINAEQGNSSKFFSSIYISKNKVDSLKIESWGYKQYSKTYKFRNYDLDKFQIKLIDSIQQKLDDIR